MSARRRLLHLGGLVFLAWALSGRPAAAPAQSSKTPPAPSPATRTTSAPSAPVSPAKAPARTAARPAAHPDSSSCVVCHARQDEDEYRLPAKLWSKDVHASVGLGCQDCHGGDPTRRSIEDEDEAADAAMDPAKGFKPAPSRLEVPDFCARCHSDAAYMKRFNPRMRVDQLAEYRTSVHGQKNKQGDEVPATCIDCHSAHGIRRVSSPDAKTYATNVPKLCAGCHADAKKMAPYKIPTTQYADYQKSVHAIALFDQGDLAAPACNDCHGNHGAAPPEARSVAHICGQCHGREAALYNESVIRPIFERLKVPECITCHGNHLVRHPTPDMFHGRSAPWVSRGRITSKDPFQADLGDLAPGDSLVAMWRDVLAPHLKPEDPRYLHRIEIGGDWGGGPLVIDATLRPDAAIPVAARVENASGLRAALRVEPIPGLPVQAGDPLQVRLSLSSPDRTLTGLRVRDLPAGGLYPHTGSACLRCHHVGDSCDVATEEIFRSIHDLDWNIRHATAVLGRAEVAGMEVSIPQFELKRDGITADVEARALIHSFDYPRIFKRAREGEVAAQAALKAGYGALEEMGVRRRGLAVSLVLIAMALLGLALKIRQVDRDRRETSSSEPR